MLPSELNFNLTFFDIVFFPLLIFSGPFSVSVSFRTAFLLLSKDIPDSYRHYGANSNENISINSFSLLRKQNLHHISLLAFSLLFHPICECQLFHLIKNEFCVMKLMRVKKSLHKCASRCADIMNESAREREIGSLFLIMLCIIFFSTFSWRALVWRIQTWESSLLFPKEFFQFKLFSMR